MALPEGVVALQTGHVSWHNQIHEHVNDRQRRPVLSPKDKNYGGVGDGVTDDTSALDNCYAECAAIGANMDLGRGAYLHGPLRWDSNTVSVFGDNSGACELRPKAAGGTIDVESDYVTAAGPRFFGFTVRGHASAPAGAVGLRLTNVSDSRWDAVVKDFTGTGSIGVHVRNVDDRTERNYFGFTLDQNHTSMQFSVDGSPVWNSFEYTEFCLRGNTWSGQTFLRSVDNCYLRGGELGVPAFNDVDDGTFLSAEDDSVWDTSAKVWGELTPQDGHPNTGFVGVARGVNARVYLRGDFELRGATYLNPPNPPGIPDPMMVLGGAFTQDTGDRIASILQAPLYVPYPAPPVIGMLGEGGTSPPVAVVEPGSNSARGRFTLGTGVAPDGAGQLCTVTFPIPWASPFAPYVVLTPTTYAAAQLRPYVFNAVTAGFWVGVGQSPIAGQPDTTYGFAYHALG